MNFSDQLLERFKPMVFVQLEVELENMSVRALKMLVLLHRPGVEHPSYTVDWLNMRGWLTDHMHIQGPRRFFARTRKSRMVGDASVRVNDVAIRLCFYSLLSSDCSSTGHLRKGLS